MKATAMGWAGSRSARPAWLLLIAVVLVTSVMVLPWHVAASLTGAPWTAPVQLADSVRHGLLSDWSRSIAAPGEGASALADEVQFWRWFHVVKAVLATGVLVASAGLVAQVWRARRASAQRWRRFGLLLASVAGGGLFLLSLVVVIANVQGAVAPLSSVLSFLPANESDVGFASAVTSLRDSLSSPQPSAGAMAIVSDFSIYHVVVAVLLGATTLLAAGLAFQLLRAREWLATGMLVVVALTFALLTVANVGTALHPIPAFDSFLSGVTS